MPFPNQPRFIPDEKPAEPSPAPASEIQLTWGVKIPLRDGVQLNATLYRPPGEARLPAVFTLTPYISDSYHARAAYFSRCGYAFALVDCRGRGNSQGSFSPMIQEVNDAADVVSWLAEQPWCDGQVSMWGGSYGGFDQWMALKAAPAALKTIVPAAAAHAGVDFPHFRGFYFPYEIQWQTLVSGVTGNAALFGDQQFWIEKFSRLFKEQRPLLELDQLTGNPNPHYQDWLQRLLDDSYWTQMALSPEEYQRIDVPILTISGHYDGDQPGALHYYKQHMLHGSAAAREHHYLVMGPWDHAGTRTPDAEVGGLKFGAASLVDLNKLHLDWYDWTMKDGAQPEFLKQRVEYYLMGADEWKYAASLEAIGAQPQRLYLSSGVGSASDAFHSGDLLDQPPAQSAADSYTYDPLDLRPAELEATEIKDYLTDQRRALNLFGAGLVYHSAPFEAATEITGWVRLSAWIAIDTPDTDFEALLYEVLLDGSSILLTQDLQRARYRLGIEHETPVPAGEVLEYTFDGFTFFSRLVAKGSRLRLVLRAPNSIYVQKNYNSGQPLPGESGKDARTCHVQLHHDAAHPSFLELPVVPARPAQGNEPPAA